MRVDTNTIYLIVQIIKVKQLLPIPADYVVLSLLPYLQI